MGKFEGYEVYKKLKKWAEDDKLQTVMTIVFIFAGIIWQIFESDGRLWFVMITGTVLISVALISSIRLIIVTTISLKATNKSIQYQAILQKVAFYSAIAGSIIKQAENHLKVENPDQRALSGYGEILNDVNKKVPNVLSMIKLKYEDFITEFPDKDTQDISYETRHNVQKTLKSNPVSDIQKEIDIQSSKIEDMNKPTNEIST